MFCFKSNNANINVINYTNNKNKPSFISMLNKTYFKMQNV